MPPVIPPARGWRLLLAVASSAAVILSSPYAAELRAMLRASLGEGFVSAMLIVLVALASLILIVAVARMKERRGARTLLLLGALAIAVVYARVFSTGNREIDVVEALHFLEYGGLTWLFYRCWRDRGDLSVILFPLLAGTFVGTLDEWLQWFVPQRVGESRDIALDLVASACGLLFSVGADPPENSRVPLLPESRALATVVIPVVACTFTAFFHTVQLAVRIGDGTRGAFLSRYTPDELDAEAKDRSSRWRSGIPFPTTRFAREDQYLAEALWHAARRDWVVADDAFAAAGEEAILERYYAPFLEAPTAGGTDRLSPAPRDETAKPAGRVFVSDAGPPYPLYPWSPLAIWGGMTFLVGISLAICFRLERLGKWAGTAQRRVETG